MKRDDKTVRKVKKLDGSETYLHHPIVIVYVGTKWWTSKRKIVGTFCAVSFSMDRL